MGRATIIAAAPTDDFSSHRGSLLRDFLHIVFKRRWLVILFFISTLATVIAVSLFYNKTVYQATAQILVSPGREHIADVTLPTGGTVLPRFSYNAEEQSARTIEMLTGRPLAEQVVRSIGPTALYTDLADNPLGRLAFWRSPLDEVDQRELAIGKFMKNVFAEAIGNTSLITLGFKSDDPEMASKAVNLLGELYLEKHLSVQKNPRTGAFFEEQFEMLKRKLKESEERFDAFKQSHNIAHSVKDEQTLALTQEAASRSALSETSSRLAEIDSRMQQLRSQLTNTSRNPAAFNAMQEKLATLEIQENEHALRLTAENPTLRYLREEIRVLREKVVGLQSRARYGTLSSGEGSLYANLEGELLRNESEQKAVRVRLNAQAAKLAEFQQRLELLGRISVEFSHLQQQVQVDEQNYRLYVTKFEESRISTAMDLEKIASVRVIEPAQPPLSPLNSKLTLKVMFGLLFAGVGSVVLAFLLQFMGGRLDTIEDVERYLELPVLASIPKLEFK